MIQIQIAGAGAGKTFGLAKLITERTETQGSEKNIYALSFTNSAKEKIQQEMIGQLGFVPANVKIETVHSFLLNEIIFPFSSYVLGHPYRISSIVHLDDNYGYRARKISALKSKNIIHSAEVFRTAKSILDKESTRNKTIAGKKKVTQVLEILIACTDSIFIDEVQDLDSDALEAFKIIGALNLFVHMIGDPKQAIKYPDAFSNFVNTCVGDSNINILEINNLTRRIPRAILTHSNRFCYPKQSQETNVEADGAIAYVERDDAGFDHFFSSHINLKSIICIDKQIASYSTHSEERHSFPHEIIERLRNSPHGRDPDLIVAAAFSEFSIRAKIDPKKSVAWLGKKHNLFFEISEYVPLIQLAERIKITPRAHQVRSIDAIKGLESDACLFILTPNTLNYFSQKHLPAEKHFNKEWKRVYVALTRAKRNLYLIIDRELFPKFDIGEIRLTLENLGVLRHVCPEN
jgi:superfamily I DNA/RNA helicase